MENLIGRKIKGFKFESTITGINYYRHMDRYNGQVGTIEAFGDNYVYVEFKDTTQIYYPIDQIQPYLIKEDMKFKLNQKVWDKSISYEAGVVRVIGYDSLIVDFQVLDIGYTLEGANNYGQKTLSATEYTYLDFSQEEIIEKGSLVYFRNNEDFPWNIGFYHEFKDGFHHCFISQQKQGESICWNFCQTTNPLI